MTWRWPEGLIPRAADCQPRNVAAGLGSVVFGMRALCCQVGYEARVGAGIGSVVFGMRALCCQFGPSPGAWPPRR